MCTSDEYAFVWTSGYKLPTKMQTTLCEKSRNGEPCDDHVVYRQAVQSEGFPDEASPAPAALQPFSDAAAMLDPPMDPAYEAASEQSDLGYIPVYFPLHKSTTRPSNRHSFRCEICHASFNRRAELKKHERRHAKPHKCPHKDCPRSNDGFGDLRDLERHKMAVHNPHYPKRMYICDHGQCAEQSTFKTFTRKDNLSRHLRQVHGIGFDVADDQSTYIEDNSPAPTHQSVNSPLQVIIRRLNGHRDTLFNPLRQDLSGVGYVHGNFQDRHQETRTIADWFATNEAWTSPEFHIPTFLSPHEDSASPEYRTIRDLVPSDSQVETSSDVVELSDSNESEPLDDRSIESSARRLRKRLRRSSILSQRPREKIPGLDEPDSSSEDDLGSELPFAQAELEIAPTEREITPRPSGYESFVPLAARSLGSGDESSDSEISDVESIMSAASSVLSASSFGSAEGFWGNPLSDLKRLFLVNDELESLYRIAVSQVGPERFQKNLRRLLTQYGNLLRKEAATFVQTQAAKFARHSSAKLAAEIKEAVARNVPQEGDKTSRQRLNKYLKDLEEPNSDNEEVDDADTESLKTLEMVENFMKSSQAFVEFRINLKKWLKIDTAEDEGPKYAEVPCIAPETPLVFMQSGAVPIPDQGELSTEHPLGSKDTALDQHRISEDHDLQRHKKLQNPASPTVVSEVKEPSSRLSERVLSSLPPVYTHMLSEAGRRWARWRSFLSDRMQPTLPLGHSRVSWNCRCGKRLHLQVPKSRQEPAIAFAQQASNSSDVNTIYVESSASDSSSVTSSTDTAGDRSSSQSSLTPLESNSGVVSADDQDEFVHPFIPAGTKKYMLLCVNSGMRLIRLANVDVTDVDDGEQIFQKMRDSYRELRGVKWRIPLLKPKVMHYVKKSKECVSNYDTNSIPSIKEIRGGQYDFQPCPPSAEDMLITPSLFMHAFLDQGDHFGQDTAAMLPKKLHSKLQWDGNVNNSLNIPAGWGFYIDERVDWALVAQCVIALVLAATVLTIVWSMVTKDVQSGTGLGSYCVGALTVLTSALVLLNGASPSLG